MLLGWLALQAVGALRPALARAELEACRGDPARAAARVAGKVRVHAAAAREPAGGAPVPTRAERARRIEVLARLGARLLPWGSPLYPVRVARLPDASPLLAVRGDASALRAPAVALVGARAASARGRDTARSLAAGLADLGFVVVSGLARGIDAAAHRGALESGGTSVALQACGPDVIYPPEHRSLDAELVRSGAVVSELPVGAPPLRHHFPLRNRLISALSQALVVVEARERSGSLISVGHARDQGVPVLAVPGPVDAPVCRGSNALLRFTGESGVAVCLEVDDVLRTLGLPPAAYVASDPLAGVESPGQRAILRALLDEPLAADDLAERLGRGAGELAADLVQLELSGRILRERDGRLQARPARGDGRSPSPAGGR